MSGWYLTTISYTDLALILEIEQHAFQSPWGRLAFEGELSCPNAISYAVKAYERCSNPRLLAYVFLRLIAAELHILKFAVAPASRRNGIGTWLLGQCLTMALQRGCEQLYLEVRPGNIAAVGLYRKFGFTVIGRRSNYYADSKEDALVLMKNLKEDL